MKTNKIGALFLFVFLTTHVYAVSFQHLSIGENKGLSSRRVFQIEKDSTGFMWFVTYMGIDRYDGSEVKQYKLNNKGIVENNYSSFTRMEKDIRGNIWIILQNGTLFKYNRDWDDFDFVLELREKLFYKDLLMTSVSFDKKNRLWICTNYGLYIYDTETGILHRTNLLSDSYPTASVHKSGDICYLANDNGIYEIEEKKELDFYIVNEYTKGQFGPIGKLHYYDRKLYIGSDRNGLHVLNIKTKESSPLLTIKNIPIRALTHTDDGRIFAGLDGAGVYVFDSESGKLLTNYISDDDSRHGLCSNTVYDIYIDENKNIWVSTYSNGISILHYSRPQVRQIQHEYKNNHSLVNNNVNALFEDSKGNLWYGTNNGVSKYDVRNRTWKHYLNDLDTKAVILALYEDENSNIWMGGFGVGGYYIDMKDEKVRKIAQKSDNSRDGLSSNYIYTIYADKENVWFGGLHGNMTQYNPRTGTFTYHNFETCDIRPLNDSTLLCATSTGFAVFNKNTNHFRIYQDSSSEKNYTVSCIYVTRKGDIWIGTEGGGLIHYNLEEEQPVFHTVKSGLESNFIQSIVEDNKEYIWFNTERGVSYIDPSTQSVVNIGGYIGLNGFGYNTNVGIICTNGDIVLGTSEGAVSFTPTYKSDLRNTAKIVFTDFKLFYNSVKTSEKSSPLEKAIDKVSSISLAHNQNSFSFLFSSINYDQPGQNVYSYKLEGFDPEWNNAPNNKSVNYTNIHPGKYTFKLRVLDKDTDYVLDERAIVININKPFWLSLPALILYTILILILLRFILQYIKNEIDKRNSRDKIQFFINIAHDIRTPVALIKAPLNEIDENESLSEKGQVSLNIALKSTEKLVSMITQLLDFQKTDVKATQLKIEKTEVKSYIKEKISLFEGEASRKKIALSLEIDFESLYAWFDRDKMEIIVNNLVSNAIKYTPEGGHVTVQIIQNDKKWELIVSDTGIGIPVIEQKFLFKRFFRAHNAINSKETGSGIGLLLAKKLVKLHKGEISFKSKENVGTEFRISFKKEETSVWRTEDIFPAGKEADSQKETILIVEDNEDMRTFLKNSLSSEYKVQLSGNGKDALDIVHETLPDLIISDVIMPEMNGDEMCSILKNSVETSHIPIILLTALTDKENIIKGLEYGADDYITKPFEISVLKARIRNILANRQKIRDIIVSQDAAYEEAEYDNPSDKEFMEKAVTLINEHLDDIDFSVNDFSSAMGMGRSSFYSKLKTLTDTSPNDFIRIIRLKKAAELLRTKRFNVSEVAIMTGFPDSKYFSTIFKKEFGISPSKYNKE